MKYTICNCVPSQIKKDLKFYSFNVVNKRDKPHVQVKHKGKKVTFAPEEISAMILGEMKRTAEVTRNMIYCWWEGA